MGQLYQVALIILREIQESSRAYLLAQPTEYTLVMIIEILTLNNYSVSFLAHKRSSCVRISLVWFWHSTLSLLTRYIIARYACILKVECSICGVLEIDTCGNLYIPQHTIAQ